MSTQTEVRPLDAGFIEELEANAVRFAHGAGEIVLGHFRTALTVEYKSHGHTSPVTVADRESEEYLRRMISETYPTHSILGEEGEDLTGTADGFTWVLDPVDGTANFISGLPLFAVSIGVLYQGEPVAAAIFVPTSSLLQTGVYHARRGHPTFLDDTPVKVATQPAPQRSKLAGLPGLFTRRMRFTGEMRQAHGEPRTLGTVAVELALAASGTLQYVFFNRPKIWDVAAGVLLVKQAGGLVLVQNRSHQPWLPLNRFETPPGKGPELERMRGWGQRIVAANPEMAWFVAGGLHSKTDLTRPVGAIARTVAQLPLFRTGDTPKL